MPFQSKAQMRYLYSQKPKVAREFAKKTHNYNSLPDKKKDVKTMSELMKVRGKKL